MRYKLERRSKKRKTFNKRIVFELAATQLNRLRNIQRNGVCLDISDDGLGFAADVALRRGGVIKLLIPASTAGTTVPVFSEVMWTYPPNDYFRTGLRFLQ